ncbi:MAG: hypothetical protein J5710_05725 [Treponema sp.]|nr:hypothetical protein [Treponema sp.]MBR5645035.1 hypothetical protein [Treponema sp.]
MNTIILNDCSSTTFLDSGAIEDNILEIHSDIIKISNKSLYNLVKDNEDLLMFPNTIEETSDKLDKDFILTVSPSQINSTPQQLLDLTIQTSKIMGFIGIGNTQININSRFESSTSNFLLHYMLQRICHVNLFDMNHYAGEADSLDIFIYFFPLFLKKAMRKGVFRAYKTFKHNDSSLRGSLDVRRHIKVNIPFCGNIAYNSREISFDNNVTELIRHTIEYIKNKPGFKSLLEGDKDIKQAVKTIVSVTTSYEKSKRKTILEANRKPISHPYYKDYSNLQSLCKIILEHKKLQYSNKGKQVYGILFDGSWLWEEYIGSILGNYGFIHPENKEKKGGIRLFDKDIEDTFDNNYGKIYPDFYKPEEFILDAKYKHLENGVGREDLYQVISYMHTMKIDEGGYIYPNKQEESNTVNRLKLNTIGYGGNLSVIGFSIPQNKKTYKEFRQSILSNEEALINYINDRYN